MVEMSQSTASRPPEPTAHLAEVTAAIAAAAKVPSARSGGGGAGGGGAGAEYDAAIAAAAGPVASAFVSLIDGMEGGSGSKNKKNQNSRSNMNMGVQTTSRHMPMRTPLMPHMSYGEKRAAVAAAAKATRKKPVAGGSVFVAGGAADRLNGTSAILAGGRDGLPENVKMNNLRMAVPPSGATITPQMAAQLGISPALIKERDLAQKIVNNPYGMSGKASTARLARDLKNGSSNAQEVAQTNPNARPRAHRGHGPKMTSR